MVALAVCILISLVAGIWIFRIHRQRQRREKLLCAPLPVEWTRILGRIKIYSLLPSALRERLHGQMNVFLDEKHFQGCGGLIMTDEVRITIAAQACLLVLNRPPPYYPSLTSILVYPSSYVAQGKHFLGNTLISEESHRAGESWKTGLVVLSWDDVLHGAYVDDGHNVVLHEFAHQLDQEFGGADGLPELKSRLQYTHWARVMANEYAELNARIDAGHKTLLDDYGAISPAEFFSVLTETFFAKPKALQECHREAYEALVQFYSVDPAAWSSG